MSETDETQPYVLHESEISSDGEVVHVFYGERGSDE